MFQSTSKPKFALELTVNELSNIPHVGGSCYIDINIRDSRKTKFPGFKAGKVSALDNVGSKTSSIPGVKKSTEAKGSHSASSPGNISATTSRKKIHNFKCLFNYKVNCNLRFPLKKRENLIGNKYLLMTVHYVGDGSNGHHSDQSSGNSGRTHIELGSLEVNLSEYLNFNEPTTSKYLLKDSKINSILSVTVGLTELSNDFDFHTLLRIQESQTTSSLSLTIHPPTRMTTGTGTGTGETFNRQKFNVPNFERKKVFGGLNDIMATQTSSEQQSTNNSASIGSTTSADDDKRSGCSGRNKIQHLASHFNHNGNHNHHQNNSSNHNNISQNGFMSKLQSIYENNNSTDSNTTTIIMEPIVNNLYKKILEASWDPELYKLMDYSPEKCIESIFEGGDGWSKDLSKKLGTWEEDDEDQVRDLNGLINEVSFRDNLKSWQVGQSS